MSKNLPSNARKARRSLRYVPMKMEDGSRRIVVGAQWLPVRIVADTPEKAEKFAMMIWGNGGRYPEPEAHTMTDPSDPHGPT